MITVEQDLFGDLILSFKYYPDYIARVKSIGARFDGDTKKWSIPSGRLLTLKSIFAGELFFKTPEWIITGEKPPDYSSLYSFTNPCDIKALGFKIPPFNYQEFGIKFLVDRLKTYKMAFTADDVGLGKCHGKGTKILMYNGSIKNVEDIQIGEKLMGDDGTIRTVLNLASGSEQMYKITLANGDFHTCNESHIIALVVSTGNRYKKWHSGDKVEMTIKEYLQLPNWVKRTVFKMYKVQIHDFGYSNYELEMDSHLYGLWLGDGTCNKLSFTINDNDTEIIDYITQYASDNNFCIRIVVGKGCHEYHLNKGAENSYQYKERELLKKSSLNGKSILPQYKYGSDDTRLKVLAGLIDTDGYLIDNCYEITTKFEQLKEDILFICRSLGFSVSWKNKIVKGRLYYRIFISGNTDKIPCMLSRKKASRRLQKKNPLVYTFNVESLGNGDYYGFEITGNRLYCLGDFTVTHNTIQAMGSFKYLFDNGAIKDLVIICKKSIKYQWMDEIKDFLDVDADIYIADDNKKKRAKTYDEIKANHRNTILIINYHLLLNDADLIKADMTIYDEVHFAKKYNGEINKACKALTKNAKYCLFMTGTPVMSNPEDMYGIVSIKDKKYFGAMKDFKERYIVEYYNGKYKNIVGFKNLDELRGKVQSIILRRTANEVAIDLPEIIPITKYCTIDEVQKKCLDLAGNKCKQTEDKIASFVSQLKSGIADTDKQKIHMEIAKLEASLKGLIAVEQIIANTPVMFHYSKSKGIQMTYKDLTPSPSYLSSKMIQLIDIVESIKDAGQKVVCFTKYETVAKYVVDLLARNKITSVMYSGSMNDAERNKAVSELKNNDECTAIVGTDAMAEG